VVCSLCNLYLLASWYVGLQFIMHHLLDSKNFNITYLCSVSVSNYIAKFTFSVVVFANNMSFFLSPILCPRVVHSLVYAMQGPALYAYNNALFTEQDWTGIRMLQDSIKETDSLKIGRFGLGFKSVFHMTGMSQ